MDLRKVFGTNKAAEQSGTWVDIGGGAKVLIARAGNKHYREVMKRLLRPHRAALRSDNMPDETLENMVIEATAQTILLGWEGVEDEGAALPYSVDNAKAMLAKYADFRDLVAGYAAEASTFKTQQDEAEVKN